MTPGTTLLKGDVVQISPEDDVFGGCFMLVEDPRSWGALGFVAVPVEGEQRPSRAYYRASWKQMELVGRATWVPADEVET